MTVKKKVSFRKMLLRDRVSIKHCNFFELCINQFQRCPSPPPPSPGQPQGIYSSCQSRGWGIRNFIAARGLGISLPRGDPRAFDTCVFELTWKSLSEKTRPSLKTGLSVTDSKNSRMFLKLCFLNFRNFFIYTCKHMNI